MKGLLFSLLILVSVSAFASRGAIPAPIPDFPFVVVTEMLEIEVMPDEVVVSFNMNAFDSSSEQAIGKVTTATSKVLEALAKRNIAASALESSQIQKNTRRGRSGGASGVTGYDVQQSFRLKVSDLEKYSGLADELIRLSEVQNIHVIFRSSKLEQHQEKMISQLSEKARRKADSLAKAQARKVKNVYGITSQGNFDQMHGQFSQTYSAAARSASRSRADATFSMSIPNSIKLVQTMTAIYELE